MKFKFAFKLHSDILRQGTRYVIEMPGLVNVMADKQTLAFKFEYEDNPVWKYVDSSVFINGWNDISLDGNGTTIVLTINTHTFVLVTGRPDTSLKTYSGFSSSSGSLYIPLSVSANTIQIDFEMYLNSSFSTSGQQNYMGLKYGFNGATIFKPSGNRICAFYTDRQLTIASNFFYADTTYYFRVIITSSNFEILTSSNGVDYTSRLNATPLSSGDLTEVSLGGGGSSWPCPYSEYTINDVKIYGDSVLVFDGATAKKGVDYMASNITETITGDTGDPYPEISTGELKTYQSWLYLKDIVARKITD